MGYIKLVLVESTGGGDAESIPKEAKLWVPDSIGSCVEGVVKGYATVGKRDKPAMAIQTQTDGMVLIPLWRERLREQVAGLHPHPGDRIWFKAIGHPKYGNRPDVCVGIDRGRWQALAIPRGWTMERVPATDVWALARVVPS